MQPPIGMRDVVVARLNFVYLRQASGLEFDARAGDVAIRFRPLQVQTYPKCELRNSLAETRALHSAFTIFL